MLWEFMQEAELNNFWLEVQVNLNLGFASYLKNIIKKNEFLDYLFIIFYY